MTTVIEMMDYTACVSRSGALGQYININGAPFCTSLVRLTVWVEQQETQVDRAAMHRRTTVIKLITTTKKLFSANSLIEQ